MKSMSAIPKTDETKEERWGGLMVQSQNGNAASYNSLLTELTPYIRNFCRHKVRYFDLSDDVVQEALVAIHRFRHTYDPNRPFMPWLHTIVRHKVIDGLRARHRVLQNEVFSNEAVALASSSPPSVANSEELKKMLSALPVDFRRPIEMLKLEELSLEEVAQRLGLSPSAVKMRIHRGFKILKKNAEKEIYEE
jgi:RNA polymerase sigma-70 factor, ECF subfamily